MLSLFFLVNISYIAMASWSRNVQFRPKKRFHQRGVASSSHLVSHLLLTKIKTVLFMTVYIRTPEILGIFFMLIISLWITQVFCGVKRKERKGRKKWREDECQSGENEVFAYFRWRERRAADAVVAGRESKETGELVPRQDPSARRSGDCPGNICEWLCKYLHYHELI